jgi:predicted phosphodiesterase
MIAAKDDKTQLLEAIEAIRKQNSEITALSGTIRGLRRENDTAEKIRAEIFGLAEHTPDPPVWIASKGGNKGSRGAPMTCWSDWHYSEVIDPDQIGGVNKFNSAIAKERAKKLVNTTIDLAYNHMGRGKTDYPGIVICLGGDMLSGDIHEELARTNDRTTWQAVNDLTDLLAGCIEEMATKFGRVFLPCVVGNHGRGTHKPQHKNRVFTSFDWTIYCNLERHFKGTKHVQFMIPAQSDAYFTVYGHRFLLTHGDSLGVKGGDGIIGALGPIMRGTLKVTASQSQIKQDVDTIVMGHWHQYITLPGLIVNNSLKGYDDYARTALRAKYSRPSQALWFTHPEYGITAHWQVYLDKLRTPADNKTFISWAT